MEINSSLPKGTVGVSEGSLPESSQYFNKTVTGKIYFKLCRDRKEGLYTEALKRIYNATTKKNTSVKRWIQRVDDMNDKKDGQATIFHGFLKLNLK